MKSNFTKLLVIAILVFQFAIIKAQTASSSSFFTAQPVPDRTLFFNLSDVGESKPISWGLDMAWLDEINLKRGILFMGLDKVDIVRASFTPTDSLVNGELKSSELATLNQRINFMNLFDAHTVVMLNDDHPSVSPWFAGNAQRWAQLIDVTTKHVQESGRKVVSVAPFNEPDYSATGQGTITDFYNICGELRQNPRFDTIRISGGNTLNTDMALTWYNTLKDRLNEGNTHQLAGTFDHYANFYTTVKADGKHATNDELHNVMEAMVGSEYGLQTGIWWGTAEYTRGEFVKASHGKRLGYAEHRNNWTAASVYRNPENKVLAFVGESERQATTTSYRFVSKDRDVFYDGHGPQREYIVNIPGGTGYQQNQPGGEKLVNITWGNDIQPIIKGKYVIVNRNSGKVLEVLMGYTTDGANILQRTYSNKSYQQWNVAPLDSTFGGDYSYFTITASHSNKAMDVNNFSLNNGENIQQWTNNNSANQLWYLEYASDGWFYIRNRYSSKCLEVANSSTSNAANIRQWEKTGGANQQWRFLSVNSSVEFNAPEAPKNLTAVENSSSISLSWTASADNDVTGYVVYRADELNGSYNVLAQNVTTTSFTDNTATDGKTHYYKIKSIDNSLNHSDYSNEVIAKITGTNDLVAKFNFEDNLLDETVNLYQAASLGVVTYSAGATSGKSIYFNGMDAFLQLSPYIANYNEITVAAWVNWKGFSNNQRVFDFGADQDHYLYFTPRNSDGKMCFGMKNNGNEEQLTYSSMTRGTWAHIAITFGNSGAKLYVDGTEVAAATSMVTSAADIQPFMNYIGRSQSDYPLFKGYIDDFRVYNHQLSSDEIKEVYNNSTGVDNIYSNNNLKISPVPADKILNINFDKLSTQGEVKIYNITGQVVLYRSNVSSNISLDVSDLSAGIYTVQVLLNNATVQKKILIVH